MTQIKHTQSCSLTPGQYQPYRNLQDAVFLLTIGSFLLTVELFLLTIDTFTLFTYSWSFFTYNFSFFYLPLELMSYNGKIRLIRA